MRTVIPVRGGPSVEIVEVHGYSQTKLPHVVGTGCNASLLPGLGQHRK